jgi:tRNA nucleotidyltransferase/poly(A) polymerase
MQPDPRKARDFAVATVDRLRQAGFTAYWAGGCVRDQLLGIEPKDYDVATDARPEEIREVFGRRRTLPVGAAFGVITVLGPREAGQIEVATFRSDATYSDGRHPDHVTFSSPKEDALRRDFTINGMFYDPLADEVIDYVGGQDDLRKGVIRAIGRADERLDEDKLRMLRAVRFAATFRFALVDDTRDAIRRRAGEVTVVSAERIAAEMERMLVDPNRAAAVRLLLDTNLAPHVLPEIAPSSPAIEPTLQALKRLQSPSFPLALATLLCELADADAAARVAARWKLSNKHSDRLHWLVAHHGRLQQAPAMRWSRLQSLLVHEGGRELVAMETAFAEAAGAETAALDYCRQMLRRPAAELDPPPLLRGDDLLRHGVSPGPAYAQLLKRARAAQLDGEIHSTEEALGLVDRWLAEDPRGQNNSSD